MTTSRRSIPSALIALVLVLLLSGLGTVFWLLGVSPLGLLNRSSAEPTSAMFVPRKAPLMVSLVVNPDRITSLRKLLSPPGQRRSSGKELKQLQNGLLAPAELNYREDVKPWLGNEATLAVTQQDLDRDPDNGEQPGYLLALSTKQPQRAREFLQLYWQRQAANGTLLHLEQVSGVQITYGESLLVGDDRKTVASALVGDRYVLFANEPKVLRDAITNVQVPELNLLNSPRYRQAMEALTGPRVAVMFSNSNALGGWIETQGLTVSAAGSEPGTTDQSKAATQTPSGLYDAVAISLGATRRGLLADTILLTAESAQTAGDDNSAPAAGANNAGNSPDQVLKYLPSNSAVAITSTQLDEFWQATEAVLETYPAIATLTHRALGDLESQWDVNFTREIFPWVKGEYAIGQLERPQGPSDWVFVVDRSSPDAQAGIANLDELALKQGYSIGNLILADRDVTAWTRLKPEGQQDSADTALRAFVRGVHTRVGGPERGNEAEEPAYEVFATSLEAMETVLQAAAQTKGYETLASSQGFRQGIAPLPESNQGYLHLNWAESEATLTEDFPLLRVLKLTARPLFRNLKSVTLSGYERGEGLQRAAVFLRLGR